MFLSHSRARKECTTQDRWVTFNFGSIKGIIATGHHRDTCDNSAQLLPLAHGLCSAPNCQHTCESDHMTVPACPENTAASTHVEKQLRHLEGNYLESAPSPSLDNLTRVRHKTFPHETSREGTYKAPFLSNIWTDKASSILLTPR